MEPAEDQATFRRTLETGIRLGVVAFLVVYCFQVVRPFLQPLVAGAILAVAIHPLHARLRGWMRGRAGLAAATLVGVLLLLLTVPAVLITTSLVESSSDLARQLQEGTLRVPPPPASVADWPLVGDPLHAFWKTASENLEAAVREAQPVVRAGGRVLLQASAATGVGIGILALAVAIAGGLLAYTESASEFAYAVARRLGGERGRELVDLGADTVESVTRGILGVALIQATMAGVGMLAAGVPAAGLWALLVLVTAVVQIPTFLTLGPIAIWVFAHASTPVAVAFAVWALLISLSDNVLKPLLMGRGANVPTLVIFVGAIGGFVFEGIIGLFVGAVALAVGYTLFQEWLENPPATAS
jgi:predicted PurR-regulated permease PerM